jgi:transposase
MLTVEHYGQIRQAHRDGMSVRAIARTQHHSRRKVREALACPEPRPYTRYRSPPSPRLGPYHALIDAILTADETAPRKQRHTMKQVYRRLRDEHGYPGGYDAVRRYIGKGRRRARETFIPLAHDPGQRLECDFGHIYVDFPEGRRPVPVLLAVWSYSYCPFAIALPTERTEAILHGLVEALAFFGGVPHEIWWDNPTTVVSEIFKGRGRRLHPRYAALASHYAFEPLFCLPAHGNEKPQAENRVYDLQRRWATPVPRARDLDELNAYLRSCCLKDRERCVAGQTESIGERFERDRAAADSLPPRPFDPCIHQPALVDKYQTVRFDSVRYSVPRAWAFAVVTVKGYVDRLEIVATGQVIARHARAYEKGQQILDPVHYLVTLGRRPAALDHSNVYRHWRLPPAFGELRAALEARHGGGAGARQYIRVLQLLAEHPVERIAQAIRRCTRPEDLHADRITQHVQRLAGRPAPHADPSCSSNGLMAVQVPLPDLRRFDQLLSPLEGELVHA